MHPIRQSLWILLALATACSHSRPAPEAPAPELTDSRVEISYGLGHTHRRFILQAKASNVSGQNFLDRQILRESSIEPARYLDYVQKISEFFEKSSRTPAAHLGSCRNPFTLTIRVGLITRSLSGCRSNDLGALSKLLRDGEFLLHSKK